MEPGPGLGFPAPGTRHRRGSAIGIEGRRGTRSALPSCLSLRPVRTVTPRVAWVGARAGRWGTPHATWPRRRLPACALPAAMHVVRIEPQLRPHCGFLSRDPVGFDLVRGVERGELAALALDGGRGRRAPDRAFRWLIVFWPSARISLISWGPRHSSSSRGEGAPALMRRQPRVVQSPITNGDAVCPL